MKTPLVSICVPTCNRAGFLKRSLATIRAQQYKPLEILIGDNTSSDETAAICTEAAAADPRIRYIRREKNIGIYSNHNRLIDESRGEFLCFLHDDDEFEPTLVQQEISFLLAHPEAGIVSPDWNLIDEQGRSLGRRTYPVPEIQTGLEYIERTLRSGRSSVGLSGTMIRRSALGHIRFDETGPIGFGDFVLWFQISEKTAVGHIADLLYSYRLHARSLSKKSILRITEDYEQALVYYCRGHLERWPDHVLLIERWRRLIHRYLFWLLVYEISLHYSTKREPGSYHLSPEEIEQALRKFRSIPPPDWLGKTARVVMELFLRSRWTWPLGTLAHFAPQFRGLAGFEP